jgi:uncharacterized protein YqfB (UPF0267 family)
MSTKNKEDELEELVHRSHKSADNEGFPELMRILKDLNPPKEEQYVITYSSNT